MEEADNVWENIGYVHYLYAGIGGVNQIKAGLGYAVTDWLSVGAPTDLLSRQHPSQLPADH